MNKLRIYTDDFAHNPREDDNLSRMIFVGKYGGLGDNHDIKFHNDYHSRQDFIDRGEIILRKQLKDVVICKPVHLYNHGGISISTSYSYPYNCRWDSGTVGFAVVTKDDIRNFWGIKRVTKDYVEEADKILEAELEELDYYVKGEIYGFEILDEEGNSIDSCGGFYGDDWKLNGMIDYIPEDLHDQLENIEIEY